RGNKETAAGGKSDMPSESRYFNEVEHSLDHMRIVPVPGLVRLQRLRNQEGNVGSDRGARVGSLKAVPLVTAWVPEHGHRGLQPEKIAVYRGNGILIVQYGEVRRECELRSSLVRALQLAPLIAIQARAEVSSVGCRALQ